VNGARRSAETPIVNAAATIAAAIREPGAPLPLAAASDAGALVDAASRHRVLLLLGYRLRAAGQLAAWPSEFQDRFRAAERLAGAVDAARHAQLERVLSALDASGVRALVIKGAALAYTDYPAPHVRTRCDADLLICSDDVPAAEQTFSALGYAREQETSGRLVSHQRHYALRDQFGVAHLFDVHWKVSDRQALADTLSFEELWATRVAVGALGPAAATVSADCALLIALVHLAGHHPGSHDLLWLYDIHLLAGRLTAQEIVAAQHRAIERGIGALARDGLMDAWRTFGGAETKVLADAIGPAQVDSQPGFWRQPSRLADIMRRDLEALPTWRARALLLREHLLPPTSYMRAKYGVGSKLLLPALYAWRVIAGAPRWLARPDPADPSR
jgi:hypothetical protein